ncbi:MAG: lytic transglycosylase domain-containing protein [Brevinema sp.]
MNVRLRFVICLFIASISFANQELTTNLAEVFVGSDPIDSSASISDKTLALGIVQKNIPKDVLDKEYDLIINEFRDIARLYQRMPSGGEKQVKLLRSLLTRLEKMEPQTDFMTYQKRIMEASVNYRLNIRGKAANILEQVITEAPYWEVRDSAARVLVSYTLVNGEINNLKKFQEKFLPYLSGNLNSTISILLKKSNELTPEEASSIFQNIVLAPAPSYQPADFKLRVLGTIKDQLNVGQLDAAINILLHEKDQKLVFSLLKVRIMLGEIPEDQLHAWGHLLGRKQRDLVKLLQAGSMRTYNNYISQYHKKAKAESRGRVYNVRLHRYRGERRGPYNVAMAEKSFKEYLSGDIEERYLAINSEYAFRNFLSEKRYDKIVEYSAIVQQKSVATVPYVNFWHAYSLLQLGETNGVIDLLGQAIAQAPESYYGILSRNLIDSLFKKSYLSKSRYFKSMKSKSSESYLDMVNYAHTLYYLGSRIDRTQAEKLYLQLGIQRNNSRMKLSPSKRNIFHAYLHLGLYQDVYALTYQDGIRNPYARDMLVGQYLLSQGRDQDFKTVITRRSDYIHNTLSFKMPKESMKMYYPLLYRESMTSLRQKTTRDMDMYLIYSVMRAESFYKPKARSRVGARGLMQIMPKTGEWLAKKYLEKGTSFSLAELYEPELNIYFGSMYLYDNIERMGMIPAIAGYNSGPNYVNSLIRKYKPNTDLELVEIHPKRETRNYVRKIMVFYHRYKAIYEGQDVEILSLLS